MSSSYFPGRNPLNYQGTNVTNPPQQYSFDRAPTEYDWETFNIGDEWRNTSVTPNIWYKLCSKARPAPPANSNARAVWKPITSVGQNDLSSLTGNSGGAIFPDSTGTINIIGTTGQISVDGSGNTLTLSLTGGGTAIDSFTPDSGTSPVVPATNGSVTMSGSGSITSVGGTNQLTYQLTGLTNHNVLVGSGTTTITKVAPSATSGVPLVSQGASADPAFGTAVVAGGGTGANSFSNLNSVVLTGSTSTNPLTSIASGSSGTVLTSNGPGVAPSWETNTASGKVTMQVFTYTGSPQTYTTPAGLTYAIVEAVGGGGGGADASNTGTTGGTTTFGALITANGGQNGFPPGSALGGAGGSATGGTFNCYGGSGGGGGFAVTDSGGIGGSSFFGGGGASQVGTGSDALCYGAGGGGGSPAPTTSRGGGGGAGGYARLIVSAATLGASQTVTIGNGGARASSDAGNGAPGIVIVTEYY